MANGAAGPTALRSSGRCTAFAPHCGAASLAASLPTTRFTPSPTSSTRQPARSSGCARSARTEAGAAGLEPLAALDHPFIQAKHDRIDAVPIARRREGKAGLAMHSPKLGTVGVARDRIGELLAF